MTQKPHEQEEALEASFDVFARSPTQYPPEGDVVGGFDVHFQIKGPKVFLEARKLLELMEMDGYTPKGSRGSPMQPPIDTPASFTDGPWCEDPAHKKAVLFQAISKKTGNEYWYHDVGRNRCFGRAPR